MRPTWLLILILAVGAIAGLLYLGRGGGVNGRDATADSLAAHGDTIAEAARAGVDSTMIADDAIEAARQARAFEADLSAQAIAQADRVGDSIRRAGPRHVRRPSPATAELLSGGNTSPCTTSDEECADSLAAAQAAKRLALAVDTAAGIADSAISSDTLVTASDSVAWLLAVVAQDSAQFAARDDRIAKLEGMYLADTIDFRRQVNGWKQRAGVLQAQVNELQRTNRAANANAKGRGKLDLGLFSIPRPRCGAGPGGTIGLASNAQGTSFGGAIGATAACIIPFSSGDD
jgi:hypothetical protein